MSNKTYHTPKLREVKYPTYSLWSFYCPACKHAHSVQVGKPPQGPAWTFNENLQAPTFSPSVRTSFQGKTLCHFFIKAGQFEFCSDCPHTMAGQTVPMVDFPETYQ